MFTIAPLSITGSPGGVVTAIGASVTGTMTWVTVSIWIERPGFTIGSPAGFTIAEVVPVATAGRARSPRSAKMSVR